MNWNLAKMYSCLYVSSINPVAISDDSFVSRSKSTLIMPIIFAFFINRQISNFFPQSLRLFDLY